MQEVHPVVIAEPDARERARLATLLAGSALELELQLQTHEATDGPTALALIEQVRPSLVLAEVLLEGLSGLALLRRLKGTAAPGQVPPFVFVTTMARESDRYWALRNGAHAYVMKPYDDDLLQSRIREVFRPSSGDLIPEKLGIL